MSACATRSALYQTFPGQPTRRSGQESRTQKIVSRNDASTARVALEAALAESRARAASWQELKALIALAELRDARREDIERLRAAHGRLREGFDTVAYRRASALLAD
jgi:hypothetical protein